MNADETDIHRRRLLQTAAAMAMGTGCGLALTACEPSSAPDEKPKASTPSFSNSTSNERVPIMSLNIVRFEYQGRAQWGVIRGNQITPIPGEFATTCHLYTSPSPRDS